MRLFGILFLCGALILAKTYASPAEYYYGDESGSEELPLARGSRVEKYKHLTRTLYAGCTWYQRRDDREAPCVSIDAEECLRWKYIWDDETEECGPPHCPNEMHWNGHKCYVRRSFRPRGPPTPPPPPVPRRPKTKVEFEEEF